MDGSIHEPDDSHAFSKLRMPGCLQAPNPLFNINYIVISLLVEKVAFKRNYFSSVGMGLKGRLPRLDPFATNHED